MRFRPTAAKPEKDVVIDLRERLAPYGEATDEASDPELEPVAATSWRRARPVRAEPYKPRHLAE